MVIELTSFPKYQEPCRVIKCVYTGYIFQAEAKLHYASKTEQYLLNCNAKRGERFIFSFLNLKNGGGGWFAMGEWPCVETGLL